MKLKKLSKDELKTIADNVGNSTKNLVLNVGEATKNAGIAVADKVKDGSEQFGNKVNQMKIEKEKKKLCPVYKDDLLSADFVLPTLINIVDYDIRKEKKSCEGAVGFLAGEDVKILNIYREFIDLVKVSFYPIVEQTVYYVDPCFNDKYIKLDEYFAYLKKVRVDELTTVAQDLGAKHVEILLRSIQNNANSQNRTKGLGAIKVGFSFSSSTSKLDATGVEVAAKIDFTGNEKPIEPTLTYFKNESDIKALIQMRLNPANENKILSKTYSLQYGNSSGIKVSDAQKIDVVLSQIHCNLNNSIASEALSESNTILEYSIVF